MNIFLKNAIDVAGNKSIAYNQNLEKRKWHIIANTSTHHKHSKTGATLRSRISIVLHIHPVSHKRTLARVTNHKYLPLYAHDLRDKPVA